MPDNEEALGREGVADLAQAEFNITTLVVGFNGGEGSNVVYVVTAPADIEEDQILEVLENRYDLQRDTAIVISPSSTETIITGCTEGGVEETRGPLPRISVEV